MPKIKTKHHPPAPAGEAEPIAHLNLTLLEVAEPHLLVELRRDRRLRPLIEGELSPTVAVVQAGRHDEVVQHLRRLGSFPRLVRPDGAK